MTLTQITEKGIKDGEIINADINASAAIAGSKISPAFGTNITTTGNAVIGGTTINTAQDKALSIFGTNGSELKLQATNFGGTAADGGAALTCTFGSLFITNNNANGDIHFQTKVSGQSTSEKMRLTEAGKLGIGTTSPSTLMELSGGGNTTLTINTGNDSGDNSQIAFADSADGNVGFINYDHGTNEMQFKVNGGTAVTITDGKDFCVGTSTAIGKAQIGTDASEIGLTVSNSSHDSYLQILATAANKNSAIFFGDNGDGNVGAIDYDHNDNSLAFKVNGGEKARFSNSGSLGIGTNNPFAPTGYSTLELSGDTGGCITFSDDDVQKFEMYGSDGYLALFNRTNNKYVAFFHKDGDLEIPDGDVRFAAGHGIDFSLTSNTSASGASMGSEVLDDYEEGTWTPVLRTQNDATEPGYSQRGGLYTKVGRQVHWVCRIDCNAAPASGSGAVQIYGLPFNGTDWSGLDWPGAPSLSYYAGLTNMGSTTNPRFLGPKDNADYVRFHSFSNSGDQSINSVNILTSSTLLIVGGTYMAT